MTYCGLPQVTPSTTRNAQAAARGKLLLSMLGLTLLVAVSFLGCQKGGEQDELIFRNGGTRLGELVACGGEQCTLSGTHYPRVGIKWIGLGNGEASPPAVRSPETDEVHFKDGSIHSGQLQSINAQAVVTEAGSFERTRVAFVYLAPSAVVQAADQKKKEETKEPIALCPDNQALGAWIWMGFDYKVRGENDYCTGDAQVRVRFRLFPSVGDKAVALAYEARELWYEVSLSKCVDVVAKIFNANVCSANSKHVSGTASLAACRT